METIVEILVLKKSSFHIMLQVVLTVKVAYRFRLGTHPDL
jgi:hypothetical protein